MLILLCIYIFVACNSTVPPIANIQNEQEGTHWELKFMVDQELLMNRAITLNIDSDMLSGSAGCNSYFITYTPQSEIQTTLMLCSPENIMKQETQYISTLAKVNNYRVENTELFLLDNKGKVLLQYYRTQ